MAIDIYSIKAGGCVAIQNAAQEYDNIISLVNQAKEESQAETIKINGATMATPFEEILEQINQAKNATINTANDVYNRAKVIYAKQIEEENEQQ